MRTKIMLRRKDSTDERLDRRLKTMRFDTFGSRKSHADDNRFAAFSVARNRRAGLYRPRGGFSRGATKLNETPIWWRTAPVPEILSPSELPAVGGPIDDARRNLDRLVEDMKTAMRFAIRNSLPILTMAVDRNGAYLVIAPVSHVYTLFGDECSLIQARPEGGLVVEQWLGCMDNVRVFWREFKAAH